MTFQTAFARIRVAISMRRRRASARGFLGTAAPVAAALVLTCSLALGASSKPPIDVGIQLRGN
jgi:hypothetical protein